MGLTHHGRCLLAANGLEFLRGLQPALEVRGVDLDVRLEGHASDDEPDLVFACGLLTREWIADGMPLDVVAAPVFPGESDAVYRSVVITSDDGPADLLAAQDGTLAVNEYGSWSGWHGYVDDLRRHGFPVPARRIVTGAHRSSIDAVRERKADVAAIDSSLWRWLPAGERRGLRVVHATADWPAPPISVRRGSDPGLTTALLAAPHLVAASTSDYDHMIDRRTPVN